MENTFSNINFLKLILKWKIHLFVVAIVAAGLSALFSGPYFITPKYKSSATLYPSNLAPYSDETPTELMLQLFYSDDIRDTIIKKFNLVKHYDIDPNDKYFYTNVIREYQDNVSIKKTEYQSVVIEVIDKNPMQACNMVKEIVNQYNKKTLRLHREKAMEVFVIAEEQLLYKKHQIDSFQVILKKIREGYGILDYSIQTKESMRNFYKNISTGPGSNSRMVESIKNLENKGGDYIEFNNYLNATLASYNVVKEQYDNALKDVTKYLTYSNYVSSPVPADKKSYPVRWLIMLIVTVSALTLSVISIIIIESFNNNKEVSKSDGES